MSAMSGHHDHDDGCEAMTPSRRAVLGAASALFAWSCVPKMAYAAPGARDPRFVVVILRGAMDGLSAVPPLAVRELTLFVALGEAVFRAPVYPVMPLTPATQVGLAAAPWVLSR
jgi:uncharacterized protein (DUF1501 family)